MNLTVSVDEDLGRVYSKEFLERAVLLNAFPKFVREYPISSRRSRKALSLGPEVGL